MKVRKLPRRINAVPSKPVKSDISISIEQSHARQIAELPKEQLQIVVDAIMEGVRYDDLIQYMANQGWLTVSEKTFKQYLTAFKRVYPELLRRNDDLDLNGVVDPSKPGLDPVALQEQLVRVQSQRIRVGLEFEKRTQITNQHLHKDIRTQRENIEVLAQMKGLTAGAGRPSADQASQQSATGSAAAQEAMRHADKSEGAQERLVGTIGNLMELIAKKQKRETVQS